MRKVLKKFIVVLLIIAILFNFSFFQSVSYGVEDIINGLLGAFVGIMTWLIRLPTVALAMSINTLTAQIAYMDNNGLNLSITPYDIFFSGAKDFDRGVELFNINFFDFDAPNSKGNIINIRKSVAKWYYVMRLLAISILLIILIYVGIRMAITSVASDKALYKKTIVDWAVSLALVFLLHYIILFTVNMNNTLLTVIKEASITSDGSHISGIIDGIATLGLMPFGVNAIGACIVYCMIVFQTFGFVFTYLTRTIKLAFLVIISPLITITYSIDKMGDGKAQALNAWLKEFIFTILRQPFHCIVYVTIVGMAFDLLKNSDDLAAAVIAILCLKFVKTAEELVKKIFKLEDDDKGTSMAAGTALAAGALSKAKNIGSAARKGINFAKENKLGEQLKKDGTKALAFAKALKKTDEEKEAEKNGTKTSLSDRMKQRQAEIEDKRAKKKAEKEDKEAEKQYEKHKHEYTPEDNQNIKNMANKIEKENPGMSSQDALKKARIKISKEKIASGAYKNKTLRKAKSFVKKVKNSETYKHMKKTIIPAGFGLAVGSMALGGDSDIITAGMTGIATGKSMSEFMKSSTSTLTSDIVAHQIGKGNFSETSVVEDTMNVKLNGDSGAYSADELKKLLDKLEAVLGKEEANKIKNKIDNNFRNNNFNFDIENLIKEITGEAIVDPAAKKAVESYKNFKHDSAIYQVISNGENVGITAETLAEKAGKDVEIEFTEETFVETAKRTIVTKETIETVRNRENYKYNDIKNILDKEISRVEKEIENLKETRDKVVNPNELYKIDKELEELIESRDLLNKNLIQVQQKESELYPEFTTKIKKIILTKEIIKEYKQNNGYEYDEIRNVIKEELSYIDKRIQNLQDRRSKATTDAERKQYDAKIDELNDSKKIAEENMNMVTMCENQEKAGG